MGSATIRPVGALTRRGTLRDVLLVVTDERCGDHLAGPSHPERPDRMWAAIEGIAVSEVADAVETITPVPAGPADLARVHEPVLLDRVYEVAARGGGRLDPDTAMNHASLDAARLAAGSVLTATHTLRARDDLRAAYCVVRPPGHHATAARSMGFCLFNSVAVAAAERVAAGDRVAIVDIDAHHGNGTQDIFYEDPHVFFASIHQSPLYPGTGGIAEQGAGSGTGTTINLPLPAGATGDVARAGIDEVIGPRIEEFAPDWIFVSAGYDGHRADPITGLGYTSADIADLVTSIQSLGPVGRTVVLLEGGYDLAAVRDCSTAVAAALLGVTDRPERPTTGGPGREVVDAAQRMRRDDG